jgi:hypothetical protein
MSATFRVEPTRDFLKTGGFLCLGAIGCGRLDDAPAVERNVRPERVAELRPTAPTDLDDVPMLARHVTAVTLAARIRATCQ